MFLLSLITILEKLHRIINRKILLSSYRLSHTVFSLYLVDSMLVYMTNLTSMEMWKLGKKHLVDIVIYHGGLHDMYNELFDRLWSNR